MWQQFEVHGAFRYHGARRRDEHPVTNRVGIGAR
jgi:hypothetical protein